MEVRDCRADDVSAIAAIYAAAVLTGTASFELEPPGLDEMVARREALLAGGYPYVVATIGSSVAGYAYAGPYRTRPAYRGTVENSVYVDEAYRRRGIAALLLHRLVKEAAGRGFRQMIAVIGDSDNRASVELHRKAGFQLAGTLHSVGWKHGRWLDTVLMQIALGPGDRQPPNGS